MLKILTLAPVILSLVAMPAYAETTLIDLDSSPGNYSMWKVSALSKTSVSFEATYLKRQKHEKWAPSYSIALGDGHGRSITFSGTYQETDVPDADMAMSVDDKKVSTGKSNLQLALMEHYKVTMSWSNSMVTVTSNGAASQYPVNFKPSELTIICSTGELEVKNITFGQ
jgi:hypothetical protein